MSNPALPAPQLVIDSRMLYTSWIPADPEACARLLPKTLRPADNHAVYMNQYVVDSEEQTTGFGAYSLSYLGLDLGGLFAPDGVTPARFFTQERATSASFHCASAARWTAQRAAAELRSWLGVARTVGGD